MIFFCGHCKSDKVETVRDLARHEYRIFCKACKELSVADMRTEEIKPVMPEEASKDIPRIGPVERSCPEALSELADSMRNLAGRIEGGEVLAVAWTELRVEDQYINNWVKAKGISKLAIGGAILSLQQEFVQSLHYDEFEEETR